MVIKHYYRFGTSVMKQMQGGGGVLDERNWDILRMSDADAFSLEKTKEEYEKNCVRSTQYEDAATIICNVLKEIGWKENRIISFGCGKGVLEWHIRKLLPERHLSLSDVTPDAIEKLKALFPDVDEWFVYDMKKGDWSEFKDDSIALIYRVSTEFSRGEWTDILTKMHMAGIDKVIYVPTEIATIGMIIKETIKHKKNIVTGVKDTFCGYSYTKDEYVKMFRGNSDEILFDIKKQVPYGNTTMFFLEGHKRNE